MPPIIDKGRCVYCKTCSDNCPLDVFKADEQKREIIIRYPDECWHCRACVLDCPAGAIKIRYPLSQFLLHQEIEKKR